MEIAVPPVRRQPAGILQVIAYNWQQGPVNVLAPLFFFLIGAFVFLMRPDNLGGRYLFLVGCYYVCVLWGFADNQFMQSLYPRLLMLLHVGWFGGFAWAWLFFPWLIQLVLVFPRRIGPMRRRPRLFPVLVHGVPVAILFAATIPFLRSGDPTNFGQANAVYAFVLLPMLLLFLVSLAGALVYNFRTIHNPVERAQLRWFALGMGLGLGGTVTVYLIGGLLNSAEPADGWLNQLVITLMNLLLLLFPLGLGIAILRYRLFDIDVIIRRTTSYAILTGLLALVYFGSIVVLQRLLTPITGDSDVAVVISTLLIAALFLPLRRRVQDAIDRRFFRRKYDAERTLEAFATTVRNETDLDALTAELLRVIQETMEPEHVSIWLKPTTAPDTRYEIRRYELSRGDHPRTPALLCAPASLR